VAPTTDRTSGVIIKVLLGIIVLLTALSSGLAAHITTRDEMINHQEEIMRQIRQEYVPRTELTARLNSIDVQLKEIKDLIRVNHGQGR
jgi:Tfp pilus assembly protein PilO